MAGVGVLAVPPVADIDQRRVHLVRRRMHRSCVDDQEMIRASLLDLGMGGYGKTRMATAGRAQSRMAFSLESEAWSIGSARSPAYRPGGIGAACAGASTGAVLPLAMPVAAAGENFTNTVY